MEARDKLDLAAELARVQRAGVTVLTWDHPAYPDRLRNINDPPPVLYVRGELTPDDDWAVAVVGTRNASNYGREATRMLAEELARAGVTVVSGLARGIDSVAHRAALDAGGRTVAVLGSGIDIIYPWENRKFAADHVEGGIDQRIPAWHSAGGEQLPPAKSHRQRAKQRRHRS